MISSDGSMKYFSPWMVWTSIVPSGNRVPNGPTNERMSPTRLSRRLSRSDKLASNSESCSAMYRSNILVIDRLSGLHCHYFLVISIRRREFLMRPTSQLQSLADNQAISRRNPTKAARAGHFLRSLYPYSFPLFPVTCRVEHRGTIDSQARKEDVQCDPRVSQMLTDCYRQ